MPDFKIVEWNEDNYDVSKNEYMKEAYANGKWAFVSDYARLDVVYNYGGIYFDTDVEAVKDFSPLLDCGLFAGFEKTGGQDVKNTDNSVAFGLGFGAVKGHPVLKELLDYYEKLSFYNADGSLNLVACPKYQTEVLKRFGLSDEERTFQKFGDIVIYPEEYFSPKSFVTGEIEVTENTYSIHHFAMTWLDEKAVKFRQKEWELSQKYGYKKAKRIVRFLSLPYRIKKKIKSLFSKK